MGFFTKKKREHAERSNRIRLLGSDNARFECAKGVFPIRNLSETGVGLFCEKNITDETLEGVLFFGDQNCPLVLEIAYSSKGALGARFSDASVVRGMIRRSFSDENFASTMSEVDAEKLKIPLEGKPRWFYSPANYELFFIEKDSKIVRVDLDLNGKFFSAASDQPLRVGDVRPESITSPTYVRSSLVKWLDKVEELDRKKAERVLQNISGLTDVERQKLIELLRS